MSHNEIGKEPCLTYINESISFGCYLIFVKKIAMKTLRVQIRNYELQCRRSSEVGHCSF